MLKNEWMPLHNTQIPRCNSRKSIYCFVALHGERRNLVNQMLVHSFGSGCSGNAASNVLQSQPALHLWCNIRSQHLFYNVLMRVSVCMCDRCMFCVFAFALSFKVLLLLFAIRSPFDELLLWASIFRFHCRFAISIRGLVDNLLNHLKLTYMTVTISLPPLLLPFYRCYCTKFSAHAHTGLTCWNCSFLWIFVVWNSFYSLVFSASHFLSSISLKLPALYELHTFIKWHSTSYQSIVSQKIRRKKRFSSIYTVAEVRWRTRKSVTFALFIVWVCAVWIN